MSGYQTETRDADIDIARLFGALWRDKFRIILGAIVITGLVFALLSLIKPKYEASTRVFLVAEETVFTRQNTDGQAIAEPVIDQESVASQVEILTSGDLLLEVAETINLAGFSEYERVLSLSTLKRTLIMLGLVSDPTVFTDEQRLLRAMRERLDVYPVENSRVIVIEFQAEDPQLAVKFPDALADAYLKIESNARLQSTGQAAEYLASEITQLQQGVRDAEARVAEFRSESGLFIGDNEETLATQQLADLSTELSRVRAERSSIEARVRTIEAALGNGAAIGTLPEVIESPLIERLSEQQVQLNTQIAELSTTFLPGHPRIQALRSQLSDLDTQISTQARNILQGLRNEAEIARGREAELDADLNELKAASSVAGDQEVELRALEREAASQRELLESYLIRFREAQSRNETDYAPPQARIIDRADVPIEPAFPKVLPILIATFFGSLLLMMLITLMRELFSGRALVPAASAVAARNNAIEETVKSVEAPVMPDADLTQMSVGEAHPIPQQQPAGAANDNFSVAHLASALIEKGAGRAIIVSPEGDAGSICSVELARTLADEGLRTVLLDLTGSGASSQHMLADFDVPGITDLLASEASYAEVIHNDAATHAHVIPTGNADAMAAMRAVERLPIIMNALGSAYDLVIVDCGPTNSTGLKRLTTQETEIIMAMVEPDSQIVLNSAQELVEGGYHDLLIVTADEVPTPAPPSPDQHRSSA